MRALRVGPDRLCLLAELHEEAQYYQDASKAASTQKQYAFHLKQFRLFCAYVGVSAERPPEAVVSCYAAFLARKVKPPTVTQYLKGCRDYFKDDGYPEFADPVRMPTLYKTIKGIYRVKKHDVQKKQPITPGMLLQYRDALDLARPEHAAIWASALVAFFGFLRKSNVATETASAFSDGKCLRWSDVEVDQQNWCLRVQPPGSKTRQTSSAPPIFIQGLPGHALDPVQAWLNHVLINAAPESPFHTAFSHRVGSTRKSVTHKMIVEAAKHMARLAGLDPASVAGHSFRRGGATWAFQCGVPEILVQRQGDWLSAQYKEYIQLSKAQALACTMAMFRGMTQNADYHKVSMQAAAAPAEHVPGGAVACMEAMV